MKTLTLQEIQTEFAAAQAYGESLGKAYWEPAEVHKDVWRREGAAAERVKTLKELLSMKREAHNEREALSPMAIVSRVSGDDIPPFTDEKVRRLQYVKAFDIEKLLAASLETERS